MKRELSVLPSFPNCIWEWIYGIFERWKFICLLSWYMHSQTLFGNEEDPYNLLLFPLVPPLLRWQTYSLVLYLKSYFFIKFQYALHQKTRNEPSESV